MEQESLPPLAFFALKAVGGGILFPSFFFKSALLSGLKSVSTLPAYLSTNGSFSLKQYGLSATTH